MSFDRRKALLLALYKIEIEAITLSNQRRNYIFLA